MVFRGDAVIEVGATRVGQQYVLGATVPLDNPNWAGPWDCAEFASWCVYQAYDGLIFGAGRVRDVRRAEPYSGAWYSEARRHGRVIGVGEALRTAGAFVIRRPPGGGRGVGHVAIAMGDGARTLEARGAAYGVGIFDGAADRPWSIGCLLPGVEYGAGAAVPGPTAQASIPGAQTGYLSLRRPHIKGPQVVALQRALAAKGVDPGPIDGDFGPMTGKAVTAFQAREGLEVDGIVGPVTAAALGLAMPIRPDAADEAAWRHDDGPPAVVALGRGDPAGAPLDLVVAVERRGNAYQARTAAGFTFLVGSPTPYSDDMHRLGLGQGRAVRADTAEKFGTYRPADYEAVDRQWAHFILPTLTAEGGRYATLNSYDRAAFTFGAPQLAAHTPDRNFVVYLRALLALPDADRHFPELVLARDAQGRQRVHLRRDGGLVNLEEEVRVRRPNGIVETQLARLMAWLNPSPTAIDDAELSAAARLMNWLRTDPRSRRLQIDVFIDEARRNLARARDRIPALGGADWRQALWVMDILHQGRGSFAEMQAAMASADPVARLGRIGPDRFEERRRTVRAGIEALAASGVLDGFRP